MPYADLKTHRLYYEGFPSENDNAGRHPIVFLHGFTLDRRSWQADAEFFSQWYRTLTLDFKGHGRSDAPQSGYSRAHRVEDVLGFMDAIGLDKVHMVGLSMGGTTALGFALKYPERLASMTLVGTSAAGFDPGPRIGHLDKLAREQGPDEAKKKWMEVALMWYKKDLAEVRDLIRQMIEDHSGAFWRDPMRGKYPREYDLKVVDRIKTPTLIQIGELDRIFLPLSRQLHELISGSKLIVYENAGHVVNLEIPDRFRADLKVFLDTAEAKRPDSGHPSD